MFRSDPIPSLLFRAQRHGEDCQDGREDDREGGRAAHRGAPAAGRDPGAVCSHPGIFSLHPLLKRLMRRLCVRVEVEEMVNFTEV